MEMGNTGYTNLQLNFFEKKEMPWKIKILSMK